MYARTVDSPSIISHKVLSSRYLNLKVLVHYYFDTTPPPLFI